MARSSLPGWRKKTKELNMLYNKYFLRLFIMFTAIFTFVTGAFSLYAKGQMTICSVEFQTMSYDDRAVIMNIAEDHSVTIYSPGNQYAFWLDTVGIYRFSISENEHAEICSMLDTKQFRKGPSQKTLYPGDAYQRVIFKQAGQSIEKLYASGINLTPYMEDVYTFFETMFQDSAKTRQPDMGLSCSIENVETDVNGQIQFSVAIINKGKITFSIPGFGTEEFFLDVGITGDIYFDLDDKYVTGLSPATKNKHVQLRPGEQYNINYSIDKSKLPVGYTTILCELTLFLPLELEKDEEPRRFLLVVAKRL